jgi:glutamine synthetase
VSSERRVDPTDTTRTGSGDLREEVIGRIERDGITKVRLLVTDLSGVARGKQITSERFVRRTIDHGHAWAQPLVAVDIWQNLSPDLADLPTGNGVIVPDLSTFAVLPWAPDTAHVLCDVEIAGEPGPTPRRALRRVLDLAHEAGFEPLFGNELEFYVYEDRDGAFAPPTVMQEWFTDQALVKLKPLIDDLYAHLVAMGVPVYEIWNEHGAGQMELNLEPATGINAIDHVIATKSALKELAIARGLKATFMPKPTNDVEVPPSGYHLHQTLNRMDGSNAFWSGDDAKPLTAEALHYIGGQLAHADGLTGVCASTVNAYKRFRPGTWAPMRAAWGIDNRGAMIRAIVNGDGTHIEHRLGSSCSNPYLLAAVQVAAGLDGIANVTDPGDPVSHDTSGDASLPLVPMNLLDGVRALAADTVLTEALGADLAKNYVAIQEEIWMRYQSHVTDWEITEYREIL